MHFTAASSVCVHFLLIQYSVPQYCSFPSTKWSETCTTTLILLTSVSFGTNWGGGCNMQFYENCCHQMWYFKARMHQIRFRLGLCPRPRWGSLAELPRFPSWISRGPTSKGRDGKRVGEKGMERGREMGSRQRGKEGREGIERGKGGPLFCLPTYPYANYRNRESKLCTFL